MPKHISRIVVFDNLRAPIEERRVLLVYERPGKAALDRHAKWRLPGGKCCDRQKAEHCCTNSPEFTAVREGIEETGLGLRVVRHLSKFDVPPSGETRFGAEVHFFLMRADMGKLRTKTYKGMVTPQWFPVSALPENLQPTHQRNIELMLERDRVFLARKTLAPPTQ